MLTWIIVGVVVILILVVIDREIYFYEGTHIGPRLQSWLYDRWAAKYDQGKQASQIDDTNSLARPMLEKIAASVGGSSEVTVLDLATGTGRLPYALLSQPEFKGHILALDISAGMLAQARKKLERFGTRVTLKQQLSFPLPFADNSFDVVCCLEALEVMPEMHTPLAELARVVKPGGILLTSRGTEASGRVGKIKSPAEFTQLLESHGFEQIEISAWWKMFDRVWARKPGQWTPTATPTESAKTQ